MAPPGASPSGCRPRSWPRQPISPEHRGALALHLLLRPAPPVGGVIIGVVSMGLLLVQGGGRQRCFEAIIVALSHHHVGVPGGLAVAPPSAAGIASGLIPRFRGTDSVPVAARCWAPRSCPTPTCTRRWSTTTQAGAARSPLPTPVTPTGNSLVACARHASTSTGRWESRAGQHRTAAPGRGALAGQSGTDTIE